MSRGLGSGTHRTKSCQMSHAFLPAVLISLLACTLGWADFYQVAINVSPLGGREAILDFSLFNGNRLYDGSWCRIDNIRLDGVPAFGTASNWYSLYPDFPLDPEVILVPDASTGDGWLEIHEGEDVSRPDPIMAARDFSAMGGARLSFNVHTYLSPTSGLFGLDRLVVTVYDWTGDQGTYLDIGDAFTVDSDGTTHHSPETTVVPAPAALLLGLLGFGAGGLGLRRGRGHLV